MRKLSSRVTVSVFASCALKNQNNLIPIFDIHLIISSIFGNCSDVYSKRSFFFFKSTKNSLSYNLIYSDPFYCRNAWQLFFFYFPTVLTFQTKLAWVLKAYEVIALNWMLYPQLNYCILGHFNQINFSMHIELLILKPRFRSNTISING